MRWNEYNRYEMRAVILFDRSLCRRCDGINIIYNIRNLYRGKRFSMITLLVWLINTYQGYPSFYSNSEITTKQAWEINSSHFFSLKLRKKRSRVYFYVSRPLVYGLGVCNLSWSSTTVCPTIGTLRETEKPVSTINAIFQLTCRESMRIKKNSSTTA